MAHREDKNSLFQSKFGDIPRIRTDIVEEYRPKPEPKPAKHADINTEPDTHPPISPYPELIDEQQLSDDFFNYRKNGVQDRVLRQLKCGQPAPQGEIDLHGKSRETALRELNEFIAKCRNKHINCILVIHGKGIRSEKHAILKQSVPQWLRQIPAILAFCPAGPGDGGSGALYVLLKNLRKP